MKPFCITVGGEFTKWYTKIIDLLCYNNNNILFYVKLHCLGIIGDMATISYSCRECGKTVRLQVAQSIAGSELVWHRGYSCENCGAGEEMDDIGVPPDDIRYEIIKTEGLWHLSIHEDGKRRLIAAKEIRAALNLPFSDVKSILRTIPGRLKSGTRAEMEWLKKRLSNKGINVEIFLEHENKNSTIPSFQQQIG